MSHLISNTTLAQISQRYNLIAKIRVAPSSRMLVKSSDNIKANVLECYIAGYFQSLIDPASENSHEVKSDTVTSTINGPMPGPRRSMTEGEAYDKVSTWLVPLFTPIAKHYRTYLHDQQAESMARGSNGSDKKGETTNLEMTAGSTARLNEYCLSNFGRGLPDYTSSQDPVTSLWETKCSIKLPNGDTMYVVTLTLSEQYTKADQIGRRVRPRLLKRREGKSRLTSY